MVNNEFDAYNGPTYRAWLTQAYQHAANKSKDKSTQLAALLVHPEQGLVAAAVNEFPKRIEVTDKRLERPAKYEYTEHAERNVIFRCAERGFSTSGLIMYCPWYSCIDCSRAIIQAGIKEVVGHKENSTIRHPIIGTNPWTKVLPCWKKRVSEQYIGRARLAMIFLFG